MDVRMPEIDGMEACRRIKPVEALRDIPIIMMTTRSPEEVLWVAFDASATDYIKKPFEEVELLARVKTTLKLKKEIDARKNWEQELTKTISELDAAFHEMVTLQQLIPILSRLQETAGRPDLTVRSRNLYSDPLQCQVQLHGLFHLFDPQGVALALFRIEGARRASLPTRVERAHSEGRLFKQRLFCS
jgi:DNA-binding response OmpR family regulator